MEVVRLAFALLKVRPHRGGGVVVLMVGNYPSFAPFGFAP